MSYDEEAKNVSIPVFPLEWSPWYPWLNVENVPREPGVYEVRRKGEKKRLTIGKAANLHQRVQGALIRGTGKHSEGTRIRKTEKLDNLEVRWAVTNFYQRASVEEYLHGLHLAAFGEPPTYTLAE